MTPTDFAAILGVHPSSLYRWEGAGAEEVRVEPMQFRLLTVLQREAGRRTNAESLATLGKGIAAALIVGGALFGLYKLLGAVFGEEATDE